MLLRSVTATMGDDTPDNVAEVGRSADGKPAGAEGGGNEDKSEDEDEDDELVDVPPFEEKKKSKINPSNRRTAQLMTLVRS